MTQRCGYIALIGRPNVGKSTLLNHLLEQKISITSRKPQTTRQQVLGVKTEGDNQIIFIDTPGLHQNSKKAINRYMNKVADSVIHDVDVLLWLIDGTQWTEAEDWILEKLKYTQCPIVLLINKIDKIKDKKSLLPLIEKLNNKKDFVAILPISATQKINFGDLEKNIINLLPEGPHFYGPDEITNRDVKFLCAEIIREKLTRQLGDELPYAITVTIEQYKSEEKIDRINAVIWVERPTQKAMVIGKQGARLKSVGTQARVDIEKLIDKKVFLELWVKVKESWADDEQALAQFGYRQE